jgi:hypothetical protein
MPDAPKGPLRSPPNMDGRSSLRYRDCLPPIASRLKSAYPEQRTAPVAANNKPRPSCGRTPPIGTRLGVAGHILVEPLADGARRLRLRDRQPIPSDGVEHVASRDEREPARVITMAWGDRYIGDLLEIAIPALLAPGNLPALAEVFDCQFVIVTESRFFDRLERSAAIAALLRFADLRLVPIDDLLSPWYGITLTYALVRGFADLGTAMTRTHLIFLNADFVVADGSYRKLAEVIRNGERLVVSPSYCMDLESTIETLYARRDRTTGALSLAKRELAEIIISHRHNTIRAKTVNQQMFRIHRYDQFYWYVDEKTLLARQMPIAVVYMRPQRALTEMTTFWDYGVISEYCPTLKPCVLGDSDDFLMAELRNEGTFRELLHLGWPTIDEIAADLSSFTTQDQRDYGRYTLVLHGADLPADIEAHKRKLAKFAEGVYARLSPPLPHRDHPFWAPQLPLFLARQQRERQKQREREAIKAKLLLEDPRQAACQQSIDALRTRMLAIEGAMRLAEQRIAAQRRAAAERLSPAEKAYRRRRAALQQEAEALVAERENSLQRLRKKLATLETEKARLEANQSSAIDRLSGTDDVPDAAPGAYGDVAARRGKTPDGTSGTDLALPVRFYHRVFGRLPDTTRWHPYHPVLQPVRDVIGSAVDAAEILLVSSGGPFGSLLVDDLPGRKLAVTPRMLDSGTYWQNFHGVRRFDFCLCDLALDDLTGFRNMLDKIRTVMNKRSRIVVFFPNLAARPFDERTFAFTRGLFPLVGRSRIRFTGSYIGALTARWCAAALARHNLARAASNVAFAATLAVLAPLARLAVLIEDRRQRHVLPARCTGMTIEIDLP